MVRKFSFFSNTATSVLYFELTIWVFGHLIFDIRPILMVILKRLKVRAWLTVRSSSRWHPNFSCALGLPPRENVYFLLLVINSIISQLLFTFYRFFSWKIKNCQWALAISYKWYLLKCAQFTKLSIASHSHIFSCTAMHLQILHYIEH